MSSLCVTATLYWLLVVTVAAQDSCTLYTTHKDEDYPCRKLLHCREPSSWVALSAELKTSSYNDRLCAIVVDCANTITISNFDFQAIGGRFKRVGNITVSRCNTSQVRLADDMGYLVEVDLSGNSFTSLDIMSDWTNSEFQIIHFYRNRITSVRRYDFDEFYYLSVVRLDSNLIADVEPGSFESSQFLKIVNLTDNRIVSLRQGMFRDLTQLKIVQLGSNRISSVASGVFANINLDLLDLSHNNIEAVPNSVFTDTSVISLNLSNCRISNIPSNFLSSVRRNLRTLDLSNNGILQIASDGFADLSHLKVIYLTGSRLAIIEQSMFPPNISEIHITSDNLHCCRLLWLQKLIAGTNFNDEVECAYPFPARLSQYKYPSYECARPEVFPITTVNVNATTMQATCVAKGVPTPNVTLGTEDGVHISQTVGISPLLFSLSTTVRLPLPRTNARGYTIVCVAVNAEGTSQTSLVIPPAVIEKTTKSTPSLKPPTASPTTPTTTTTTTTSITSTTQPPAVTTTTSPSTTPSPTTTTTASTTSTTQPPAVTTTTTPSTTPSTTTSTTTTKTSTISTSPPAVTTTTTPSTTQSPTPSPTTTTTTSLSSTQRTTANVSDDQGISVKTTQMVSTKSVEVTAEESDSYVKWIIVASVVTAIVIVVVIVALVVMRRKRLTNRNRDSMLCFENLDGNQNDGSSVAGDNEYCVIPADIDAIDNPIHFTANSAMSDVDYATIGAAGGRVESQVNGKVQDATPTYMTLNDVGKHGGSVEHEYDRLDTATASKRATSSSGEDNGKPHMRVKRPRTRHR